MADLASQADVEAVLGRGLTPSELDRARMFLGKVSSQFRRIAKRNFSLTESTARLKVSGGTVTIRDYPVVSVSQVTDDAGAPVPFERVGSRIFLARASHEFVNVTYSAGSAVVDPLVVATVAEAVARAIEIPTAAKQGVSQMTESVGGMSLTQSFAPWAQGGQALLAPSEVAVAESFRIKPPRIHVTTAGVAAPTRERDFQHELEEEGR